MTQLPICAILDDYQNVALDCADWSALSGQITLRRYDSPLGNEDALATALADCSVLVAMRERTAFPASLLARLPNLKLLITTGARNRSIDLVAAQNYGVTVCGTASAGTGAAELAWAGLLSFQRKLPQEIENFRANGPWQISLGTSLFDKQLGIVGLGKLGRKMAQYGQAFDMKVAGWTRSNLGQRAHDLGLTAQELPQLFETSDVITLQVVQNPQTTGMIGADLLNRMKPDALLINTARGPLVDEAALIQALEQGKIGGAILDVFDREPLPADHPFRHLPNVMATPHIGYVTQQNYRAYYGGAVENITAWLNGKPNRVLTPPTP